MPGPVDDKRLATALTPIAPNGTGEDCRSDPLYEAVQAEIDRLGSVGAGAIDWRLVRTNSLKLLEKKSKDLRLASYLALALLYTERQRGLAVGLAILEGLVRDFWDGLYPKRVPPRLSAISMVGERAALVIQHAPLSADDITAAAELSDQLASLRAQLEAKAGDALRERARDGDGGLDPLWSQLREYRAKLAVLAPTKPEEKAAENQAAEEQVADSNEPVIDEQAAAKKTTQAETTQSVQTAQPTAATQQSPPPPPPPRPVDLSSLTGWVREETAKLRAANLSDARSYLLLRFSEWLSYDQLVLKDGKLDVIGPAAATRATFATLVATSQFAELVQQAETCLVQRHLWLDLHRYTDHGLRGLGEKHEAARRAVRGAVAALLVRLPDLPKARFSDGAPVADAETQAWLGEFMGGKPSAAATDPVADLLAAATQLRAKGDVKAALALFTAGTGGGGGRERFRRQLAQARFGFENGMIGPVLPMVEEMTAEAARLDLAEWEPALAAELHRLACQCLTHADAAKVRSDLDRRAGLLSHRGRLFRVDPAAALEFGKI